MWFYNNIQEISRAWPYVYVSVRHITANNDTLKLSIHRVNVSTMRKTHFSQAQKRFLWQDITICFHTGPFSIYDWEANHEIRCHTMGNETFQLYCTYMYTCQELRTRFGFCCVLLWLGSICFNPHPLRSFHQYWDNPTVAHWSNHAISPVPMTRICKMHRTNPLRIVDIPPNL